MKDNIASKNTKKLLAGTMKELLKSQDFSKITISGIAKAADINRKTFYYHFRSTEDLLAWMLERETFDIVSRFTLPGDLPIEINFIIDYIEENHAMLKSISGTVGRGAIHKFLYNNIYPLIMSQINQLNSQEILSPNYQDLLYDEQYKEFVAEFYTEAISGMLENLVENLDPASREKIVEYTVRLFKAQGLDTFTKSAS